MINTDKIVIGLKHFQEWLLDLTRLNLVTTSKDLIIHVDESVTKKFCIGMANNRFFFGIQEEELRWFGAFPWLHLAARINHKRLYFVCDEQIVEAAMLPCFALSFQPESLQKIELIASKSTIDVRKIEIDEYGNVVMISRDPVMTLPIVSDFEEGSIGGLKGGKLKHKPKFDNRKKNPNEHR